MAKQRIQNYVFLPGTASSSNAYPNAYWLINANKTFIKKEAVAFLSSKVASDTAVNYYPYAYDLLTSNKAFLADEMIAWINYQVANNISPFVSYTYDSAKCRRDFGYLFDAICYDIRYGGNEETIRILKYYWLSGTAQVRQFAEVAFYTQLRSMLTNYILSNSTYTSQQSPVVTTQVTRAYDAETAAVTRVYALITLVNNVIQNGLSVLPASNSVVYPNAVKAISDNKEFLKEEIAAWIETQVDEQSVYNLAPEAYSSLTLNKLFIGEEAVAWINYQIANSIPPFVSPNIVTYDPAGTKCKRDVGYIVDAIAKDLRFGGNENLRKVLSMYWINDVAQIDGPRTPEVATYEFVKGLINNYILPNVLYTSLQTNATQNVSGGSPESGVVATVTAALDSAKATIQNGPGSLPAAVNPTYIFGAYTYDKEKCKRDVGYIIDAYSYDVAYGGNEKTYETVSLYWINGVAQIDGSRLQEVAAHDKLKNIINSYIIPNVAYSSDQPTVLASQVFDTTGETAAQAQITTLSAIVKDVIENGLSALPTLASANGKNYSTRTYAGYTYDSAKCERDIGYVLDAYLNDLRYGGNYKTRFVISRYWEGSTPQVDGDRKPEEDAHKFIRDLINNHIITNVPQETPYQTTYEQVTDLGYTGEENAKSRIRTLSYYVTNVIQNGLDAMPALVNGVSTIKIQGKHELGALLLITNVSKNEILYNFSDPLNPAIITYDSTYNSNGIAREEDFPKFLQTADYVTTVTLDYDTTTSSADDEIQIFVEQKEMKIRPYDFGTDAIERMRVAPPQSMLDADFEYGLQPTKWQAIGIARGYPSVYEIPGTDTPVLTVTTDASTGTGGVGESLITVTTAGSHGFIVGTPITIRSLANTISGFSRAEGTFLVNTVPSLTSFTYYAVAKVGTSNGQVLATTYTQLRKGSFYTGAALGSPTFNVASNGTTASITTIFNTPSGSDQLAWTSINLPEVGSPLTGTGVGAGAQITAVVGTGGLAVTGNIEYDVQINDTDITLVDSTGVLEGMAIDDGTGTSIFVSGLNGNIVNFTGPIKTFRRGRTSSYTNVGGTHISPVGAGATFDVNRVLGVYQVSVVAPGSNYIAGNRIKILGSVLGGTDGVNDLTITASTVSPEDSVTSFDNATLVGGTGYSNTTYPTTGGTGTGLTVSVTVDGLNVITAISIVTPGTGYTVGDVITVDGGGSDASIHVLTIDSGQITSITTSGVSVDGGASYTLVTQNSITSGGFYPAVGTVSTTSGVGSGARFDVTRRFGSYTVVKAATSTDLNYAVNDTITITGDWLGGSTPVHDLVITVTGIGLNGEIDTFTHTGTGSSISAGADAVFTVARSLSVYTVPAITTAGTGYLVGDDLVILGSVLGGTDGVNDLTLTVNAIDLDGGITSVSVEGTAITGNATFGTLSGTNYTPAGVNGTFNITRSNGSYTVVTPNNTGSAYQQGDEILVLGTSLGGTTPTNDAVVRILGTAGSGQISSASISGTAIGGTTLEVYSGIAFSELTTQVIPAGTVLSSSAIAQIEVIFQSPHGLVPGANMLVDITSSGTNHTLAKGPFYAEQVPTLNTVRYTVRATGAVDTSTPLAGIVYARPDSYFIHRPYDGGVMLGTGGPQHGAQAIRMSKKYIRYQSGKGIMYTTGALFAPSYNLQALTSTGLTIGSFITVTTDDVDHGCQVGGIIRIQGVDTGGYNGRYTVVDVLNERQLRVQAQSVLASTVAQITTSAQMAIQEWHGATVRAGCFDDQNGMYWQYNGRTVAVGRRSSTFQLAGTISINADSNIVTGSNTRFRDQVKAGDRIVIKGMTHVVSNVTSQSTLYVTPDYRGAVNCVQSKACLVVDTIINQDEFNLDRLDGTGPSGYNIDVSYMQMIGLQYTWYGAGFIDYMLRGSDGNYVFCHRIRNSNVNTEAYMRTGNMPVRYEVINESALSALRESITSTQTTIPLVNASTFPNESGVVYIDNELIAFNGKSGNTLVGCTRASPMTNFVGGAQRTFRAGSASSHEYNTGVILVSNTISPIISHWGSAFLTDGRFDEDRGYIFNYASTGISISTTKTTAFLIRLAPSVSNAIVGDLGERELINRAQLLLKEIAVTSDTGTGGIVIEGVLNPQNYPLNPGSVSWGGLAGLAQGGQPSFAQIAPGGSVNWNSSGSQSTSTATTLGTITGNLTVPNSTAFNRASGTAFAYVTQTSWNTLGATTGFSVNDAKFPAGTTVSNISTSSSPVATVLDTVSTTVTMFGATLAVSTGSGSGAVATLFFTAQSFTPYPIGSTIVVSGVNPGAYNGTFTVTNAGTNFVQYASTAAGTPSGGTITTRYNAGSTVLRITKASWEAMTNPVTAVGFKPSTSYFADGTTVTAVSVIQGTSPNQWYNVTFSSGSIAPISNGNTMTMSLGGSYGSRTTVLYTSGSWNALPIDVPVVGNTTNDSKFTAGTTISSISTLRTFATTGYYSVVHSTAANLTGNQTVTYSHTPYYQVFFSASSTSAVNANANITLQLAPSSVASNFAYFTQSSWETLVSSYGAASGTEVSDAKFAAGTRIQTISALKTFSGTNYYTVTFTQTSNAPITGSSTVTFKFGNPPYALPGETVFSFISQPGGTSSLDLSELKELTNTALGGRGTFPNGPDVLAINVYKVSGSAVTSNIIVRWGEAQA